MRKKLAILTAAVVILTCVFAFTACDDKPEMQTLSELTLPQMEDNQACVIIKEGESKYSCFVVTLGEDGTTAQNGEQLLQYLQEKSNLALNWQDSAYGKYLLGIGNITADESKGEFVAIFTSVEKDKGSWAGVRSYQAGETELVSSAVGISEMTVQPGAVIYFEISTY